MNIREAYKHWSSVYDANENRTRDLDAVATREMTAGLAVDTLVEIGCGTGKNTVWFAEKAARVYALDISPEMLACAREKVNAAHVSFIQADITGGMPLADGLADFAVCNLVLEHIEDMRGVFRDVYRILKSGGQFLICELHPFKQYAGGKANFTVGEQHITVECYHHHFSDYWSCAAGAGFRCIDVQEWFVTEKDSEIPRLLGLLFEK